MLYLCKSGRSSIEFMPLYSGTMTGIMFQDSWVEENLITCPECSGFQEDFDL